MPKITPEEVRAVIKKFWDSFSKKLTGQFNQMYSPSATVFAADARRGESARLMLVRRERELFGPGCAVGGKLGSIDVQVLSDDMAVASYPFHFSTTRDLPNGKRVKVEMPFGRATQAFQRDASGDLKIIHEHMSSAESTTTVELPKAGPG
jgi:ketosteroid isomerase-like protein